MLHPNAGRKSAAKRKRPRVLNMHFKRHAPRHSSRRFPIRQTAIPNTERPTAALKNEGNIYIRKIETDMQAEHQNKQDIPHKLKFEFK